MCIYSHEDGAYCDKHDHGAVTVGCCGEESCPDRKVLTNYDLLISKTPEELAEAIYSVVDSCPRGKRPEGTCVVNAYDCCACWLSWLKAPVEEGER